MSKKNAHVKYYYFSFYYICDSRIIEQYSGNNGKKMPPKKEKIFNKVVVGVQGIEPCVSWSQTKHVSRYTTPRISQDLDKYHALSS